MGIAVLGAACLGAACLGAARLELAREGGGTFLRLPPGLGRGSLLGWGVAGGSPVLTTQAGQAGVGTGTLATLPYPAATTLLGAASSCPAERVCALAWVCAWLPRPSNHPASPSSSSSLSSSSVFSVKALQHCCPAGARCHLLRSEPASRSLEPLKEPRTRLSRVWQM